MSKYVIFQISGGMGKCIAATAVCQAIKKKYPDRKLVVISCWSDIFKNLDFVDRYHQIGNMEYFYNDYVKNKTSILLANDPYFQTSYINREKHLIEVWCECLGLEYNGEQPILKFTYPELKTVNTLWANQGTVPYIILQTCGGAHSVDYHWGRDIPQETAQKIVNRYKDQYLIYHVTRQTGYSLHGVERVTDWNLTNRALLGGLLMSSKRILIDSCLQHASKALGLSSVVLWHGTTPNMLGYDANQNICSDLPESFDRKFAVFDEVTFDDEGSDCPYDDPSTIFDLNEIYNAIDGVQNDPS